MWTETGARPAQDAWWCGRSGSTPPTGPLALTASQPCGRAPERTGAGPSSRPGHREAPPSTRTGTAARAPGRVQHLRPCFKAAGGRRAPRRGGAPRPWHSSASLIHTRRRPRSVALAPMGLSRGEREHSLAQTSRSVCALRRDVSRSAQRTRGRGHSADCTTASGQGRPSLTVVPPGLSAPGSTLGKGGHRLAGVFMKPCRGQVPPEDTRCPTQGGPPCPQPPAAGGR